MTTELANATPEKLKALMGDGWNAELQKRTGKHRNTITRVIDNMELGHKVMKAAIKLAEEKKSEEELAAQRLNQLMEKVA